MRPLRDRRRAPFLVLLAAIVALPLFGAPTSAPALGSSFPCHWNWELATNLRPGYAVAGASADCAGRARSLTIDVRLQHWLPKTHRWRTLKAATKRFHDLSKNRFVQAAKRCASPAAVKYRARLSWTLRGTGGGIVARHKYTAGPLTVGC